MRALRFGPDIVVATPGRLLDHVGQRTIDLSGVEILVLDEADRMLDMGFIRDIRRVLEVLPPKRQNLLFSATFSDEIRRLARGFLHDPASVQVTPRNSAAPTRDAGRPPGRPRAQARAAEPPRQDRHAIEQALVFTRTKHGANRLAEQLEKDGIAAVAIHGNKSQPQRMRALADFKAGRLAVLVATEIAARGLDIDALPHVVNFELPMVPEDYVHRIGRTGRAGVAGKAVSLVCVDEMKLLRRDRGASSAPDPDRGHRGLRARPLDPPRADPPRRPRPDDAGRSFGWRAWPATPDGPTADATGARPRWLRASASPGSTTRRSLGIEPGAPTRRRAARVRAASVRWAASRGNAAPGWARSSAGPALPQGPAPTSGIRLPAGPAATARPRLIRPKPRVRR